MIRIKKITYRGELPTILLAANEAKTLTALHVNIKGPYLWQIFILE